MGEVVLAQFHNLVPARKGFVVNQAVDATARSYNLQALLLPKACNPAAPEYVFLTLQASGANDVFWYCDALVTATMDNTTVNAAGTAWTVTSQDPTVPAILRTGQDVRIRIQKNVDIYLHLKCAAAGTANVRISVTSQAQ